MAYKQFLNEIQSKYSLASDRIEELNGNEIYIHVKPDDFFNYCFALHEELPSTVMALFAKEEGSIFRIYCSFIGIKLKKWFWVTIDIAKDHPHFNSIAKKIYSANLFEREIREMFGIESIGNPDIRRLHLHEEVWPSGAYPLRKDFIAPKTIKGSGEYEFTKVEGEGIFEVPVGPVHAGIIGPGHFRFSVAGEPIINLEIRLGFTHRGIEKLMENKLPAEALLLAECTAGDAAFSHSLAFCQAIERICKISVPDRSEKIRALFLELERMYNHVADIGGIALDVGFSQPAALASIIKESIQQLNDKLTGNRFLKGVNCIGGINKDINFDQEKIIIDTLALVRHDFETLKKMLLSSVSFLDRVDTTGVLKKKTAEDFGVLGPAGRASGIDQDLRADFPGIYADLAFKKLILGSGDVLARLNIRIHEFEQADNLICEILTKLPINKKLTFIPEKCPAGFALGYVESWRGSVLYWININHDGKIDRCKIVDPSFRNWQGLAYAVYENIIPDFPVCNKSFNLSYAGNDL
ncbi:MAG: NADH-quinone oxidoreductase subunit C [Patescibacteria group bacterium]